MRADVERVVRGADLSGWESQEIEYGAEALRVRLPADCAVLAMRAAPPFADAGAAIRDSILQPVGCPPLATILRDKGRPARELTVCIATSDITRPVPYAGPSGILRPLLDALHTAGILPEHVLLLVGTGTHRASTDAEKVSMFGADVVGRYRIVDHTCDDPDALVDIGKTRSGVAIHLNKAFYRADVKIATGLVESHFMAGVSAGRKAVCPALVSWQTIEQFHSARFLASPRATNLVLDGNPCHEEALEIARAAGVDFAVNVVLNRDLQVIGAFSGALEASHQRAFELVRTLVSVPVEEPFDVVLTHGGYVGINHYQNAKAAVNALPILRPRGFLILAACERDLDPVGPATYKTLLHLLKLQGPDGYLATLCNPAWRFTRDQWEPQMWGKVLAKVGEDGLLYCSAVLGPEREEVIPGRLGWDFLDRAAPHEGRAAAEAMVQQAVIYAVHHPRWQGRRARIAFVREGPYAVPTLAAGAVIR